MDGIPSRNNVVGAGPMPTGALKNVPIANESIAPRVVRPVYGLGGKPLGSHPRCYRPIAASQFQACAALWSI